MNAGRDVERLIADWFVEEAVLRAPDRVLEDAGRGVDRTKQRHPWRLPWRNPTRSRFALLGAAATFVAAIAVGGLALTSQNRPPDAGSASPSATATESAAPIATEPAAPSLSPFLSTLTNTFQSSVYGYSMRTDPSWTFTRATVDADSKVATDDNASDHIEITGTDTTISVTANDLAGQSFEGWLDGIHQGVIDEASVPASCIDGEPASWPRLAVGKETGVVMTLCNAAQVFVEANQRAYTFAWSHDTVDDASHLDVRDFERVLETVEFEAAGARPLPPRNVPMTERMGMLGGSYRYPASWIRSGGGVEWTATQPNTGPSLTFNHSAAPLDGSQTPAEWVAQRAEAETMCQDVRPPPPELVIGGSRGYLLSQCGILGGRRHFLAVVVHDSVGYSFHMDAKVGNAAAWFETLLATVTFDESASEAP